MKATEDIIHFVCYPHKLTKEHTETVKKSELPFAFADEHSYFTICDLHFEKDKFENYIHPSLVNCPVCLEIAKKITDTPLGGLRILSKTKENLNDNRKG